MLKSTSASSRSACSAAAGTSTITPAVGSGRPPPPRTTPPRPRWTPSAPCTHTSAPVVRTAAATGVQLRGQHLRPHPRHPQAPYAQGPGWAPAAARGTAAACRRPRPASAARPSARPRPNAASYAACCSRPVRAVVPVEEQELGRNSPTPSAAAIPVPQPRPHRRPRWPGRPPSRCCSSCTARPSRRPPGAGVVRQLGRSHRSTASERVSDRHWTAERKAIAAPRHRPPG
jgi:hypothetical protein